jgi:hypothetical protein
MFISIAIEPLRHGLEAGTAFFDDDIDIVQHDFSTVDATCDTEASRFVGQKIGNDANKFV